MPKPETVTKALEQIGKSVANYRYFFEKVNGPEWLVPLAQNGFFRHPPEKEEVEGGVVFPGWPSSQLLVRMARNPSAQEQVLAIALAIPETDNVNVHADLLEVALALPAHESAKLAAKARSWVQSAYRGMVSSKIGGLIAHLANGGEANAALQLAKETFALLPSAPTSGDSDSEWPPSPEPRGWLEAWYYEEALQIAVPALVTADGRRTLELFCALLVRSLELSRSRDDDRHQDYSYIWRDAIEQDEHPPRLRDSLISAVRNSAERVIDMAPYNVMTVLEVLRRYDWPVFKRIELYLLSRFPDAVLGEIVAMAPALVELDPSTKHEAALLLKSVFAKLPPQAQDEVLRRIDQGPDEAAFVRSLEFIGEQPTPEKIAKFGAYWRAQRFSLFADHVPEVWQGRVRAVLASAGEVRRPDEVEPVTMWVGPTSPKTADDLVQLGPEGVLAFLREWTPKTDPLESTPEGLGRILQGVIVRDPVGYVERVADFRSVDPTFIRFFLSALEMAVKESRMFAWQPVLSLAQWVVEQPRKIRGRKKALMEADPDWEWTRGTIANLLQAGLQDQAGTIEFAKREQVWAILEPLTRDPDPSTEYEAKYGGKNMEPPTMAINTVRGKAFNALVAYALWVRRHLDRLEHKHPMTFDVMPEVRRVLDEHLDLRIEPTLTIRSVYGRYFPWLQHLDPVWAQDAVGRIFSGHPEQSSYWTAAWEAYVVFCRAYDEVLPVLRTPYTRAVAEVAQHDPTTKRHHNQQQHLGQHLMTYYWRGTIAIDDALITEFFRMASDEVRGSAMEYVGRSLANASEEIPVNILQRLRDLWDWRLRSARASGDMTSYQRELAKFGWWFASRKFDDTWSLEQLRTVLESTNLVEPDFKVSETLEALAPRFPLDSILCVTRIVQADRKGWTILGNRDHFQSILRTALRSGSAGARAAAERLIEYLVGRGNFEYRQLLS